MNIQEILKIESKNTIIFKKSDINLIYKNNEDPIKIPESQLESFIKNELKSNSIKEYIEIENNKFKLYRWGYPGYWNDYLYLLNDNIPTIMSISIKSKVSICFIMNDNNLIEKDNLIKESNPIENKKTAYYYEFEDDTIYSNLYLFLIELNVTEVIYDNKKINRILNNLGIVNNFIENSKGSIENLKSYLNLEFKIKEYNFQFMKLDLFNLYCDFNCKTNHGKRLLNLYLRQPLINKSEIEKRLDLSEVISLDLSGINDLTGFVKKIQNGSIGINEIVKVYEILNYVSVIECNLNIIIENLKENCKTVKDYEKYSDSNDDENNKEKVIKLIQYEFLEPLNHLKENIIPLLKFINNTIEIKKQPYEYNRKNNKKLEILYEKKMNIELSIKNEYNEILKINKRIKMENVKENFMFKLSRIDYKNFKDFKKYHFLEKNLLKSGIYFVNKNLDELNKKLDEWNNEYNEECLVIKKELLRVLTYYIPFMEGFNHLVALLDVYSAFNEKVRNSSYCRPIFNDSNNNLNSLDNNFCSRKIKYEIVDSFHPLLEFKGCIKNSIDFDNKNICVITGPNMGGKSTFIKQCAIISILAQIGCYVPCKYCNIPIFDGIYTRIGASDCSIKGESTFMREMMDISRICRLATNKSLIIIDELGRGTSAKDGLSIAIAVCNYLKNKGITFFTTHFPQICDLDVLNKKVLIDDNVMLYKLVDGKCDYSYGLNVCKAVGFPQEVIDEAEKLINDYPD